MGVLKGKADGGSGGKRGHSNMDHWMANSEVKAAARKRRRLDSKEAVARETAAFAESERETLMSEGRRATRMLKGKTVKVVKRHRSGEVLVEFTDGTRLYVDAHADSVELSITYGAPAV